MIVDVDERSLSAIGQWPWRRDRRRHADRPHAELGASDIALDIIFAESDRYDGSRASPTGRSAGRRASRAAASCSATR